MKGLPLWSGKRALNDSFRPINWFSRASAFVVLADGDIAFASFRQQLHPFIKNSFNPLAVQAPQSVGPQNE